MQYFFKDTILAAYAKKPSTSMLVLFVLSVTFSLFGCSPKNIKPIENGEKIGVVLLHGKDAYTTKMVDPLAWRLSSAGIKVVTPLMPWSKGRIYDKSFDDSLAEIQGHVQKLRNQGASKVIIAGHSLGAVTTAGYGARVGDVDGLILLAPGHFTNQPGFSQYSGGDLTKAKTMVESGMGEDKASFGDVNSGARTTRHITANIFLSWFSPAGPAEFVDNMSRIDRRIPILYIAGSLDSIPETRNREYAFDKVARHSKSQFLIIESSHLDVPERADVAVIEWIRNL